MTQREAEAMTRAVELLSAVFRFIDLNPVSDYKVFYDEAMCDGACLAEDCAIAREELEMLLESQKGRSV